MGLLKGIGRSLVCRVNQYKSLSTSLFALYLSILFFEMFISNRGKSVIFNKDKWTVYQHDRTKRFVPQ